MWMYGLTESVPLTSEPWISSLVLSSRSMIGFMTSPTPAIEYFLPDSAIKMGK